MLPSVALHSKLRQILSRIYVFLRSQTRTCCHLWPCFTFVRSLHSGASMSRQTQTTYVKRTYDFKRHLCRHKYQNQGRSKPNSKINKNQLRHCQMSNDKWTLLMTYTHTFVIIFHYIITNVNKKKWSRMRAYQLHLMLPSVALHSKLRQILSHIYVFLTSQTRTWCHLWPCLNFKRSFW